LKKAINVNTNLSTKHHCLSTKSK